jgi:sporulation protein YlmC with PRC-barrel domain
MKKLGSIKGGKIHGIDGEVGKLDDFYFDDQAWTVRYLVLDTGGLLTGRLSLLSPSAIENIDWDDKQVSMRVTKKIVEEAPSAAADEPVSRQYETALSRHYGWPYYWEGPYLWGLAYYPTPVPRQAGAALEQQDEAPQPHGDPALRSLKEVSGYHVQSTTGEIGHIDDFVVDTETWEVRYLVIDTSNYWFGGEVVISPHWVREVNWPNAKVYVDLTREQIKEAPEYDPAMPIERSYEERLHRHYQRQVYWSEAKHAP